MYFFRGNTVFLPWNGLASFQWGRGDGLGDDVLHTNNPISCVLSGELLSEEALDHLLRQGIEDKSSV